MTDDDIVTTYRAFVPVILELEVITRTGADEADTLTGLMLAFNSDIGDPLKGAPLLIRPVGMIIARTRGAKLTGQATLEKVKP